MKIAVIQEWLVTVGGSDKVVKALGVNRGFCTENNCIVVYNGILDERFRAVGLGSRTIVTLSRYDYPKNMSLCLDIVRLMKDTGFYGWAMEKIMPS